MDVVIHQGAQGGVRTSVSELRKVTEINVSETVNVFQSSVDKDVNHATLTSSSSVYGEPEYLPYDEQHPIDR